MQRDTGVVVKRAETGLGLFATKPIPKGKRIIEYVGPLIGNDKIQNSPGRYFLWVNKKWSIDGKSRTNLARYINHSCVPNTNIFASHRRVWFWSRRKIRAGEEITCDYGKDYFNAFIAPVGCRCAKCDSK
jgi:hypothetical protein